MDPRWARKDKALGSVCSPKSQAHKNEHHSGCCAFPSVMGNGIFCTAHCSSMVHILPLCPAPASRGTSCPEQSCRQAAPTPQKAPPEIPKRFKNSTRQS